MIPFAILSLSVLAAPPQDAPPDETSDAGREAELRERYVAVMREGALVWAELAEWAFEEELYREAGLLAQRVLVTIPDHAAGTMSRRIAAIDAATYADRYEVALRKRGGTFRKKLRAAAEPHGDALVGLAREAAQADLPALAEELYVAAFEADPDNGKAKKELRKLDYDLIYNYGVLPRADKEEARRTLWSLGGSFMTSRDLREELEFWSDAWGLETRHFRFVTNAPHRTVFGFARACEDLYECFDQVFGEAGVKLRKLKDPATVYLFDSPVTYQSILRTTGMDVPSTDGLLGFYTSRTEIGYFYDKPDFYAGDLTLLIETFYHEGTHQLVHLRMKAAWKGGGARYPMAWVDEGVALYMELIEVDVSGEDRTYRVGEFIDDDLGRGIDAYLAGALMPLEEFAHLDREGFDGYGHNYAHAALLTHFLMNGGGDAYREAFWDMLTSYQEQGGTQEPLSELLGRDPQELATELDAYVRGLDARLERRTYAGEGDRR